jgi:hypothetical protein
MQFTIQIAEQNIGGNTIVNFFSARAYDRRQSHYRLPPKPLEFAILQDGSLLAQPVVLTW